MTRAEQKTPPKFESIRPARRSAYSGTFPRSVAKAQPNFECVAQHFATLARRKRVELVGCSASARGLETQGAPLQLIRQMRAVLANLVKHVDMYADLSRRYGLSLERGTEQSPAKQDKYELARDNLIRGCLSGAVQAVMAQYQAEAAADAAIRSAFREIAADERRHNELAWEIAAWLTPRLTPGQAQQLRETQQRAIAAARHQLETAAPAELQYFAGFPPTADALSLLETLVAELFFDRESA